MRNFSSPYNLELKINFEITIEHIFEDILINNFNKFLQI